MTERGLPDSLVGRLRARYGEPHRSYHDLTHLDQVLSRVEELRAVASDPVAVRLAAWFHDAVYDPRRADNEQRSADLAAALLPPTGVPPHRVGEVVRLVRLTTTHDPDPTDANGTVLCDADLAVLAEEPAQYDAYVAAVRAEYGHVSDADFAAGRRAILEHLLSGPQLFRTTTGRARWEQRARRNITRELKVLSAAGQRTEDAWGDATPPR